MILQVQCSSSELAHDTDFMEFVDDIALTVMASPNVTYVDSIEVPADVRERERAIEAGKEDLASKPEAMRAKIVQGRVEKLLKTRSLLAQPFVKDPSKTVQGTCIRKCGGVD